jgi:hypothetical protein
MKKFRQSERIAMSNAQRFTQFEPLPDVREFIRFATKEEAMTIRHLVNRALRREMAHLGYTPRQSTERDILVTSSERQD